MASKLELDPTTVRLWDFFQNSKYKLLSDPTQKLDDAQIHDNQAMLLEVRHAVPLSLAPSVLMPRHRGTGATRRWHLPPRGGQRGRMALWSGLAGL